MDDQRLGHEPRPRPPRLDYTNAVDPAPTALEWLSLWSIYLLLCGVAALVLVVAIASAGSENAYHATLSFGFLTYLVGITLAAISLTLGGGRWLIMWWRRRGEP